MREVIWMPHPGHFCAASACRFIMNTYVNGVIVSTVGEYLPIKEVKEINDKFRYIDPNESAQEKKMREAGFEPIGYSRYYETMVFNATKGEHKCCPYEAIVIGGDTLDFEGYNDSGEAFAGHNALVEKYRNLKK